MCVSLCKLKAREIVVSAYIRSRHVLGRARSSRGVGWNGVFCAFYSGSEDIMKQAVEGIRYVEERGGRFDTS